MLQFKEQYKGHTIECVVDAHSVFDFGKSIVTTCSSDEIKYTDAKGESKILHCHFQRGLNKGKNKGLLAMINELQLKLTYKIILQDLQNLLSGHPAFKTVRDSLLLGKLKIHCDFKITLGFMFGTSDRKIWRGDKILPKVPLRAQLYRGFMVLSEDIDPSNQRSDVQINAEIDHSFT